ncbi:MAG: histidine kinase [Bacteroidales bacterium]|nr:histidine kinase [Bacteroidales bacterium]
MKKSFRLFIIITLIGFLFCSYLYYSETGRFPEYFKQPLLLILIVFLSNLIGWSIIFSNKLLDKFILWKNNIAFRFITGIISNSILYIILAFLAFTLYVTISAEDITIYSALNKFSEVLIKLGILSFITIFIYSIIDFSLYSYNQYSVVQIESVKLLSQQMELQFEALKSQLSPHYLFNNLNTISSLIYKDPELSEKYIRKLVKTYQYILKTNDRKLVKLSEELEFIYAYIFLLEVRFGEALKINININNEYIHYNLPPLSLQILIENAVKHNSFDKENTLNITIEQYKTDYLIIKNNILKKSVVKDSFKIGLNNINKRYKYFTNKKLQIVKNNDFKVVLPLLND